MRSLIASLMLLAGCATAHQDAAVLPSSGWSGYAWNGEIGAAARRFGSQEAAHARMLQDYEGCDVQAAIALRQINEQSQQKADALHLACMAYRGWLPVRVDGRNR